ncbi:precorrin-2 dehydrogenase/sirohydrochlorin ferrochelatase family protein [Zavarzinia sp. CC-PAN008]|uniref:precorrin-2 dehydrogenase/sirohydrochlorin ferrochelatase family protein n=1 Tax=Zavarzinia sp. CC-PAN008 TaxID=3243332 RepID=UPI003F747618
MLPLALDLSKTPVLLAGQGAGLLRRLDLVEAGGGTGVLVFAPEAEADLAARAGDGLRRCLPGRGDFRAGGLLFAAGLPAETAGALYHAARAAGMLVNVEDVIPYCDFHVPALVRRGDLLLTVSTGGRSPGLARRLKRYLERLFGPEWGPRLDELAAERSRWRNAGLDIATVSAQTEDLIDRKGWLQ